MISRMAAISAVIILVAAVSTYFLLGAVREPHIEEVHLHADFKVYLDGEMLDFAQEKYMSAANRTLSNFAHLHDMDGDVLHIHAKGVTLGFFFKTLGMTFNSTCFVTDNGAEYCNSESKALKLYVNGVRNSEFGKYRPQDLDKILISYGSESEAQIQAQLETIADKACIQSGKCPEKGIPGNESSCSIAGCIDEDPDFLLP